MRRRPSSFAAGDLFGNPILVGSIILIVTVIGVLLSYNANKGLPYVPTYQIYAEVRDAAKLTPGGSEVRIGGARIGIVKEIEALPAEGGEPVRARLLLDLQDDQRGLPRDTEVRVRPRSILGAKYLDVIPGTSGRSIPPGGTIPVEPSQDVVELEEAFNVFDDETSQGIRSAITNLGDALAGRGADINETVSELGAALPPAERALRVIADPRTDLDGLVDGLARTFRALEPVAPRLASLFEKGTTTLEAVDAAGPALGAAIEELPRLAATGTRALRTARPVLADAAGIARDLRPGARALPVAARRLDSALRTATPVLERTPRLADDLRDTLAALGTLARDPATPGAVKLLTTTVTTLDRTLDVLLPAQRTCNLLGVGLRNLASVVSTGNADGTSLVTTLVLDVEQVLQHATPSPNFHTNPAPVNDDTECETGNEPFLPGQQIGNPPGRQPAHTEETAPPAAATARARRAGLLREVPGR